MVLGYKVEYAWWHYPDDKLSINKVYAKTYEDAKSKMTDILDHHYYCARIVPITKSGGLVK